DAEGVAGLEAHVLERLRALAHPVAQLAGEQVHRLVLPLVVLHGERVAGVDVQDLARVAVGLRPDDLVAPRLRHHTGLDATAHHTTGAAACSCSCSSCARSAASTGSAPSSPSHRAITAVARQLPTRFTDVRAMSINA